MKNRVRPRQETLAKTARLLQRAGFYLVDLHTVRPSCIDILARRDSLLLLIKVLKNVDAVGERATEALWSLARMMGGAPLLLGNVSGTQPLEEGVVYNRYGLSILTYETLENYVLKGLPPFLFSSPGGIFARIDGRRLKMMREEVNLSLGAVADAVGVSRRTIQLYEDGAGAEVGIVERLERFLGASLALPINVFGEKGGFRLKDKNHSSAENVESKEDWAHRVLSELGGQGWTLTVTEKSPFDALARPKDLAEKDLVVMGMGDLIYAEKRARWLHEIASVAEGWSLFVVPEREDRESIGGTPIVAYRELLRHPDPKSLFELIAERS